MRGRTQSSCARIIRASVAGALLVGWLCVGLQVSATAVGRDSGSPSASPTATSGGVSGDKSKSTVTFGPQPASATAPDARASFTYTTNPGAQFIDHVALLNYSSVPLAVNVYATDATPSAQGGVDFKTQDQRPTQVGSWVRVGLPSSRPVTVPPRTAGSAGIVIVPFTVTIPATALPGDHIGAIMMSTSTGSTNPQGAKFDLVQRVASRIYVRVTGALHALLTIDSIAAQYNGSPNPFGKGSATVDYVVHNAGNVNLGVQQAVTLSGTLGATGTATQIPDIKLLAPGGSARVTVVVAGVLPEFLEHTHVAITPRGLAGNVNPTLQDASAETTFWAIPWPLVAVILLVCLLALWGLRRRRQPERSSSGDHAHARAQEPKVKQAV